MKAILKTLLRPIASTMTAVGIDLRKLVHLRHYRSYRKQRGEWLRQGGNITRNYMILSDYCDLAGTASGHYFHQDLLVASMIFERNPKRHIDVGSRVDGFVAHVASFRAIEVLDVRPLPDSPHENITFVQADLMTQCDFGKTDSLSCLHVIEHFGLGRYGEPVDVNGHKKGIYNLVNLVSSGGIMYLSFPIGARDEVHFNAHRVFHPRSILSYPSIKENMKLIRFDFVDDSGNLNMNSNPENLYPIPRHGCGIYTFQRRP